MHIDIWYVEIVSSESRLLNHAFVEMIILYNQFV